MKRKSSNFYLFLALYFVGILMVPPTAVDKLRSFSVASISPFWKPVFAARSFSSGTHEDFCFLSEENQRLKLENARLHNQIKAVNEWILFQERIEQQFDHLKNIKAMNEKDLYWKDFFLRRAEEMAKILEGQLQALPARVIYKDMTCEADQVWINVGYYHNDILGRLIVAKNSPVLVGNNLVGVIDRVEAKKSLVTLITDSSLPISVRAVRGGSKSIVSLHNIDLLQTMLSQEECFDSSNEKELFVTLLGKLENKLKKSQKSEYAAKGLMRGAKRSWVRYKELLLVGEEFNYNYSDKEGSSRDIFTEKVLSGEEKACPLLQKGDLLVSTGMDSVFPAGFHVGIVTKIKQGKSSYAKAIEAKPMIANLDGLQTVFVIPPYDLSYID